ncbi:ComEC/Rec2 family competence protein [Microbacterium jiangjiandongii]|uniref:ComEC/Rec2 family competence protein n=1 Tax=Microbacterium jiangjiandongii TaxID=3049071 RepID=UPI00214CA30D|nr:ComEC/Rec2 family competence protein [Microbacterium sp. zg.Y843]MCR2814523.1 ComEC/Rec2 family competence protein [Microbacterium sp. zg.Y843]
MSLRRARRRDIRLVPAVVGAWAAALWGAAHADSLVGLAVGAWMLALGSLALAWLSRRSSLRTAAAVIVIACAGAAAVLSHLAVAQPGRAVAHLNVDGGRALRVVATVTGKVEPSATALRFDAVADRVMIGDDTHALSLPVTVQVSADAVAELPDLAPGARVEAVGTAFRADAGERSVLVVRATAGLTVLAPPAGVLAATAHLRERLAASTFGLPPPGAGLVPGLAVGDTSAVSEDLDAAMKASSLSHLTAVSGANCALVVGIAFAAAAVCGARRAVRVACGLGALAGFVVLVTPEPSVVRAGMMAAIAMLGVLLGRVGAGLSVLCLAVIVLLVADPWIAGEIGFALSVAATASLLMLSGPLSDGIARWMPRPLALALSVPLAAQLACGPLLIIVEPSLPLYGVAANLLAAPAAPVATVVGLAACLAAPLPILQAGLSAIAWLPAAWIAGTAQTMATLPGATVPWPEGGWGVAALVAVGTAIAVVCVPPGSGRLMRPARALAALLLAGAVGVGAGAGALSTVLAPATVPPDWSIAACDVGQGDAVLVRSAGAVALIDTGPDPDALASCLGRFGIARIDLLVLTHFDADHVDGAAAVLGRVGLVVHGPAAAPVADAVLARLHDGGAQLIEGVTGIGGSLGDARWRVLWPRSGAGIPAGNDASVVLDVAGGGVPPTLLLGDLSAEPQQALAASGALRAAYAVVKVAHHGSADQSAHLYRLLRPAIALITVGADNDYGHPRAQILDLLHALGAAVARTDQDGIVALSVMDDDGVDGVAVWRERAPPGVDVGTPG